jgi:hypothetical protein
MFAEEILKTKNIMTHYQTNQKLKTKRFSVKYLAVLSFILLGLTTVLTSCSKDDEPIDQGTETPGPQAILPTITLESGSTGTFLGVVGSPTAGSLQYTIKATAPNGFNKLVIEKVVNGNANEYETIDTTHPNYVAGSNTFTYNLNYILSENDANKSLEFKAMILDDHNYADNIIFAHADTKMPMLFSYLPMRADNPVSASPNIPYYIYADNDELKKETRNGILNSTLDNKILAVLSMNDGSGLYFSAPNTTLETQLTDDLSYKSATKFKEQNFGFEEFYNYSIYDAHEMKAIFDAVPFNSHEEKAEDVEIGKVYSFLSENDEAGLMYVKDMEVVGNVFYVDVDIFFAR